MPTFKNMDVCLPFLKQKQREEKNPVRKAGIQIAIEIITALPAEHVEEGIICAKCFFYNKEAKRCSHKNGLMGRVRPEMFCSYGSYHYEESEEEPFPDDEFPEFGEEEE